MTLEIQEIEAPMNSSTKTYCICKASKYEFAMDQDMLYAKRGEMEKDPHLIHGVEEPVGEDGERLLVLFALAAGDHAAEVDVQEGGLQPDVPPNKVPRVLVVHFQVLLHCREEFDRAVLDPAETPLQLHLMIHGGI